MAPHSSTLAWKIPWMEEPGRLESMGLLRVGHDWATSLSLFIFMPWRRKWQLTPVFLPGESQGRGSLVGCRLWAVYGLLGVGHDWSDLATAAAVFNCQHFCRPRSSRYWERHQCLSTLQLFPDTTDSLPRLPGAVTGLRKVWLEGDSGGSHINMGGAWMTMLSCRYFSVSKDEIQVPLKFILKTIKLTEKDSKKKYKWEKDLRGVPGQDYVRQNFFYFQIFPRIPACSKWP